MKRILLALILTIFASTGYAQDGGLLFQVSGRSLAQPSYLYGTFHLICPGDLLLTEAMKKALGETRQLYLELDFDDPALQATMMKSMLLADGKNLKDYLKAEDYSVLDSYLQRSLGIGLAQLGRFKPIALLSMMYVKILECQPASYDVTLAQLAGKDGKEILGLETVEEQMAVLERIPLEQQLKNLVDMARKPEDTRKEINELTSAYKAQDLDRIMKLMAESNFDVDTEQELLVKRNTNWIPIIEKAAQDKPTFFAFGAGHLGGPKGVVSLLREKGYAVTALK